MLLTPVSSNLSLLLPASRGGGVQGFSQPWSFSICSLPVPAVFALLELLELGPSHPMELSLGHVCVLEKEKEVRQQGGAACMPAG